MDDHTDIFPKGKKTRPVFESYEAYQKYCRELYEEIRPEIEEYPQKGSEHGHCHGAQSERSQDVGGFWNVFAGSHEERAEGDDQEARREADPEGSVGEVHQGYGREQGAV